MTTIDTIHDLSRILREHPEWREELRRTLLTEELLALPQRLAEYAEATARRLDALTESVASLVEHGKSVDRRLDNLMEYAELIKLRSDDIDRRQAINTRHIGELKGMFMERDAADNAALIASDMGLVWQRTLDRQDVVALVNEAVRTGKAEGIPANHLRVLRRADLIMEAADERWPAQLHRCRDFVDSSRVGHRPRHSQRRLCLALHRQDNLCNGGKRARGQGDRGHIDAGRAAAPRLRNLREGVPRNGRRADHR